MRRFVSWYNTIRQLRHCCCYTALLNWYYFFLIEPTRRTPHLYEIVLAMGMVMGHTLLPLLACALMIPNWYCTTTPSFLYCDSAPIELILLSPFPFLRLCAHQLNFESVNQCRKGVPLTWRVAMLSDRHTVSD